MTQSANENEIGGTLPPVLEPDAHGQAALMLCESMLHALMERGTFTTEQAMSVVSTAQEIKVECAYLAGESRGRMQASLDLLSTIAASLEKELP